MVLVLDEKSFFSTRKNLKRRSTGHGNLASSIPSPTTQHYVRQRAPGIIDSITDDAPLTSVLLNPLASHYCRGVRSHSPPLKVGHCSGPTTSRRRRVEVWPCWHSPDNIDHLKTTRGWFVGPLRDRRVGSDGVHGAGDV